MECKKCAIDTMNVLETFGLLDELVKFYRRDWLEDIAKAQIHDTKALLSSRLHKIMDSCDLPKESPIAKIATDLDKAETLENIQWATQNFEGALYQSLKM